MEKLKIYLSETTDESNRTEIPHESSFIDNFKRQNKGLLLVAAIILGCVGLLVAVAFLKDKAAKEKALKENVQKPVPENQSTGLARKAVENLRQIPRDIDPDREDIADVLKAVCTSANEEFDRINPDELDINIRTALLRSIMGCWSARTDASDPLVVPEDIEDIPRTMEYKIIRDKSFRQNISKLLGNREEAAKKLGM